MSSQPGDHLYKVQSTERVETQSERESKDARQGRARMSSTLSDAAEEWKRRQQLKAKKSFREASPLPSSPASSNNYDGKVPPPPPPRENKPKTIPGYMSSTKASRHGRFSQGEIDVEGDGNNSDDGDGKSRSDSPTIIRDQKEVIPNKLRRTESCRDSPVTPPPMGRMGNFLNKFRSASFKERPVSASRRPPPVSASPGPSPRSRSGSSPSPINIDANTPPYRTSSPRSARPRSASGGSSFKESSSSTEGNTTTPVKKGSFKEKKESVTSPLVDTSKVPPSPKSDDSSSPKKTTEPHSPKSPKGVGSPMRVRSKTTTATKGGSTWSKTPNWAQKHRARTVSTQGIPGTSYTERSSSGHGPTATRGAARTMDRHAKARARSTSPRSGTSASRGASSPRTAPQRTSKDNTTKSGQRSTSSPRKASSPARASSATDRANRRSSSYIPKKGTVKKGMASGSGGGTVVLRPLRLYTTEDHMPIKCARVCVEYLRVWLLLSAATPKQWRGSRLARKVIDECSIYKDSSSTHARYRKLMRLVHPDSLVSLKGEEPTSALTLAMSGGLLRTYNAANEILEHEEKANDHAASACLVSPGDFPPGGHPSARTRNKSMATHLFILAEKLAADPNLLHSNAKSGARLIQSLAALRLVSEEHRSGVIGDMLQEEERRTADEKKERKAAAKRAEAEAAAEAARAAAGDGADMADMD